MVDHPDLTPIKSSMATHAHYDPQGQTLHVRFKNGSTFRYDGVAADKGHTVMNAASFGSAFNKLITGNRRHVGRKV